MAILYMNGFDQYNTPADLQTDENFIGTTENGVWTLSTGTGVVHGTRALFMNSTGDNGNFHHLINNNNDSHTLFIGLHFRFDQAGGSAKYPFRMQDINGIDFVSCQGNGADWQMINGDGATIIDLPDLNINQQYWLEFALVVHKTNGSLFAYRDGALWGSVTGVNTSHAGSVDDLPRINTFRGTGGVSQWWDNFYVADNTGPTNNSLLGELAVLNIVPNSDSLAQWTPSTGGDNYALVDQLDGASADYNSVAAPNLTDLYGFTDLPATGDAVLAVQMMNRVQDASDGSTYTPQINSGAHTNILPVLNTDTSINFKYTDILDYQDNASVAWDEAAVNAVIAGITSNDKFSYLLGVDTGNQKITSAESDGKSGSWTTGIVGDILVASTGAVVKVTAVATDMLTYSVLLGTTQEIQDGLQYPMPYRVLNDVGGVDNSDEHYYFDNGGLYPWPG